MFCYSCDRYIFSELKGRNSLYDAVVYRFDNMGRICAEKKKIALYVFCQSACLLLLHVLFLKTVLTGLSIHFIN